MPPSNARRKIQLMYGNGGGGHKASATAVQKILMTSPAAPLLDIQLIDASAIAGAGPGDWLYNTLLSFNAVSVIEMLHSTLQTVIMPIALPSLRQAFRAHFAKTPDLSCVVSFVPFLNAVFAESLNPHIALFTVLTDFSHTQNHPWIQHPRQHIVAGTDVAVAQALSEGFVLQPIPSAAMRLTATSGMVVHPRFYNFLSQHLRRRKLRELGFPPDLPTVLLLFGAQSPTDRVLRLVDLFLQRAPPAAVNVIAICGENKGLYHRLTRRKVASRERRLFVTGFTNQIPLFMQLSDVLIGKPGPGVVSEAFVSGLPCILITGASEAQVMKQEKDVLDWVRRERIGIVARSVQEAANVTLAQIEDMRQAISDKPANRAVFEVRDLILCKLEFPVPSSEDDSKLKLLTDPTEKPESFSASEDSFYAQEHSSRKDGSEPPSSPREIDLGDLDLHIAPSRKLTVTQNPIADICELPTRTTSSR